MSIAIYKFIKTMKWEYRGTTIELFLVGIHHPNYPDKIWEEARTIWKVVLGGTEISTTRTGDREEVLAAQKAFIDWLIDDPDMTQLF
jgi:hypothetical protein